MACDELSTGTLLLLPESVGLGRVFPKGVAMGESAARGDGAANGAGDGLMSSLLVTLSVSCIPPVQWPGIPHMK